MGALPAVLASTPSLYTFATFLQRLARYHPFGFHRIHAELTRSLRSEGAILFTLQLAHLHHGSARYLRPASRLLHRLQGVGDQERLRENLQVVAETSRGGEGSECCIIALDPDVGRRSRELLCEPFVSGCRGIDLV